MLQRLPFTSVEILGNFEGFALVQVIDGQGNLVPLSEERSYVLSQGQAYQLRVALQSQEPPDGIFEFIRLTDGQDVDSFNFTVSLDCDTLRFEPDELDFTVRAKQAEATAETSHIATEAEKGVHTLFVQVFQQNTLVQVVRLDLEIQ